MPSGRGQSGLVIITDCGSQATLRQIIPESGDSASGPHSRGIQ